ncbi:MAG TPA: hypothetical protein VJX31_04990 [Casimicrobiaceae bacterium]|nr:hypothetical protein [Casimicrobiaceae bacterium]
MRSAQPGLIRGAFLIEALVAILVVSIAIAGLFALMANLIRASGDALLRAEAAEIAAAAVARMAAENPASLADRYATPESAGFAVLAAAAQRLPGVTRTANLPTVSVADGPSLGTRRVVVGVQWQAPTAPAPHRAMMTTVVGP